VPKAQVRRVFRARFRAGLEALRSQQDLPPIDPRVWQRDWGVKLQPFGDGQNAIKYLAAYVARAAIGNSRIRSITDTHVAFHTGLPLLVGPARQPAPVPPPWPVFPPAPVVASP
jgi:hypothetical protein